VAELDGSNLDRSWIEFGGSDRFSGVALGYALIGADGGIENIGGPDKITFEQMAREVLARQGEAKTVVVDPHAAHIGTPLSTNSLVTP
jgi:hypothetical protein